MGDVPCSALIFTAFLMFLAAKAILLAHRHTVPLELIRKLTFSLCPTLVGVGV